MNALKIIIGILYAVILATSGGIVIFYLWKATRKPSLFDTCKWLDTKRKGNHIDKYICYPRGRLSSRYDSKAPEYCKDYAQREEKD